MIKSKHQDRLLILDFGSQYTQLIARRIREIGVYCALWSGDTHIDDIRAFKPAGIILSGSPCSVRDPQAPQLPAGLFDMDVPVLGICYGMQAMLAHFGATD